MEVMQLQDIRYDVKDRTLFEINNLRIHKGDKIGLVGRNGSGKTSLLQIIAKEKEPAAGYVSTQSSVTLLPQLKPKIGELSGGEISQSMIEKTLAEQPEVLLADEPTTHLDTENMEKLEQQLQHRAGTLVLVSHDRAFLDALCTQIWELVDGQLQVFIGNYSDYEQQKRAARQHHEKEYQKYIQKKKQLEEAMLQKEKKAQRAVKKPKNTSRSEAKITGAKPYFAKKQKKLNQGVSSIETRLNQLEKVEKRKELPPIKMQVAKEDALKNRTIIRGTQVEGNIGDRQLWHSVDFSIIAGQTIALLGANGSGKTTFLNKIMNAEDGIHVSPAVSFGYFSQMLEVLDVEASMMDNVRNSSQQDQTLIRTVLARLGFFRDDVFKPVHVLSGGERVKVAFAKLFVSDANVLILDEPTNFLDIEAVQALESLLVDYSGTVLLVSHDRRFIENTATRLFVIEKKHIQVFDGSYRAFVRTEPNLAEDELLMIEMKISEVLSRLSIEPSEALDEQFQQLLQQKKQLEQK